MSFLRWLTRKREWSTVPEDLEEFAAAMLKQARRAAIMVIGLSVVLIGVALLVLPGPGVLVGLLGLGILATEFLWARRWLKQLKSGAAQLASAAMRHAGAAKSGDERPPAPEGPKPPLQRTD